MLSPAIWSSKTAAKQLQKKKTASSAGPQTITNEAVHCPQHFSLQAHHTRNLLREVMNLINTGSYYHQIHADSTIPKSTSFFASRFHPPSHSQEETCQAGVPAAAWLFAATPAAFPYKYGILSQGQNSSALPV